MSNIKPYIRAMQLYPVGESSVPGFEKVIHLASNENNHPPSEAVLDAVKMSMQQTNRYADSSCRKVIDQLAAHHHLSGEKIVCGNGSAALIFLLAEALLSQQDEMLVLKHGYALYETAAQRVGATLIRASAKVGQFIDPQALIGACTSRTKLVLIDNPNNPTGAFIPLSTLREIRERLPQDILLVIDAAYAEYVNAEEYDGGLSLVNEYDNVCVLRSFSKIYGLAGARMGWLYGPLPIIHALKVLQAPASVSSAAQSAAVAALVHDKERIQELRVQNKHLCQVFTAHCSALGLTPYPSEANFVLVDFLSADLAKEVFSALKMKGIIVRPMASNRLPSCLRFTIGTMGEMDSLQKALSEIIQEKRC